MQDYLFSPSLVKTEGVFPLFGNTPLTCLDFEVPLGLEQEIKLKSRLYIRPAPDHGADSEQEQRRSEELMYSHTYYPIKELFGPWFKAQQQQPIGIAEYRDFLTDLKMRISACGYDLLMFQHMGYKC